MDFRFVLVILCVLTSCHVVISKEDDDSASEQSGPTGVKPEGDLVMKTTQSDLYRVRRIGIRATDTQPIRGVSNLSDNTACKGVQALALPDSQKNTRDKKRSPL